MDTPLARCAQGRAAAGELPSASPGVGVTTRRGFLRVAGASAAFATLASLRALPDSLAAAARTGERFFSAEQTELLTQVVERLVGPDETQAPAVRDTRTLETIDAVCRSLDPALTAPLGWLLRLVDYGPFLFELRLARFTGLDASEQEAHLAGWMRSRFGWRRLGFQALRNLAFLGYYAQEETWPALGYLGPLPPPEEASP